MATSDDVYYFINAPAPNEKLPICQGKCFCTKKRIKFSSDKAIPGYNYVKILGTGNFGAVHLYKDRKTRQTVAIKSISYTPHGQNFHTLLLEYNIVFGIPYFNIIKYHNSFYNPKLEKCYIVMEYMEQGSLRQAIYEHTKKKIIFQKRFVFEIMRGLIWGMQHLNKYHIVHCDLKPENVMIDDNNVIKICDFGSVRYNFDINSPVTSASHYRAPELYQHNIRPNEKTEVYAIGVIFFELCNLQRPFESVTTTDQLLKKVQAEQFPPLIGRDEDNEELLEMMLRFYPANRHNLSDLLKHRQLI